MTRRLTPPTPAEVHACPWWWCDDGDPRPMRLTVNELGRVVEVVDGHEIPVEEMEAEWAPCVVPGAPGLVEAARELVAARDAAKAADRARAKADHKAFSGGKPLPKRPGKNAVFLHDLPPEEQQRLKEQCEREMAPVIEAGRAATAAKERLDRAWAALRAALPKETP